MLAINAADAEAQLIKNILAFTLSVGLPIILRLYMEMEETGKVTIKRIIKVTFFSFAICYFVHVLIVISEVPFIARLYHLFLGVFSYLSTDILRSLHKKKSKLADKIVDRGIDKMIQ